MTFSNAALATYLTDVAKIIGQERDYLASGMWNPNFCSADAIDRAEDLSDALRRRLDHIDGLCARARALDSPRTE